MTRTRGGPRDYTVDPDARVEACASEASTPHRVDVGIPAWGHSPYLSEAIASVRRQTFTSWRLHVSQDGGPEQSVEALVASARDERLVYSATGSRIGAPRNKTALVRTGDAPYLALLDHDDVWKPDFLARRVEFLEENPGCSFVFSPALVIDTGGKVLERTPRLVSDGVYSSAEIVPLLLQASGIPGGSVVVRRSAYRDVGEDFCDDLPRTYDYEMWLRLALRSEVGYLALWDTCWRRHGMNASTTQLQGYDREYERLVTRLSLLVERDLPEWPVGTRFWNHKANALLLMTSLDAQKLGDRRTARRYLTRAVRTHPRSAFTKRTIAVALVVLFGRFGAGLVAGAKRIKALWNRGAS
jgi:glycosyltransferase involved in cell wall biosynthesis